MCAAGLVTAICVGGVLSPGTGDTGFQILSVLGATFGAVAAVKFWRLFRHGTEAGTALRALLAAFVCSPRLSTSRSQCPPNQARRPLPPFAQSGYRLRGLTPAAGDAPSLGLAV